MPHCLLDRYSLFAYFDDRISMFSIDENTFATGLIGQVISHVEHVLYGESERLTKETE